MKPIIAGVSVLECLFDFLRGLIDRRLFSREAAGDKAFLRCLVVATIAVVGPASGTASAQSYPTKPVRIVVGFAPGGAIDTVARIVAAALSAQWGHSVLVDNRPAAGGMVATEFVAKAPPDGYTLLLCLPASHAIAPARSHKPPYDHIKDFSFPSMIGAVPNVFMVHPAMPVRSLRQFIAFAKARPGKINYGSSGVGSTPHLSIELLKIMTGIDIVHVSYRGAAPALIDVISGQIESSVGNLAGGPLAAIKTGRLRALGVTSAIRSKQLPEVPTFAEAGVPGYEVTGWSGICAPAGLSRAVLAKLNADLVKVFDGAARKGLEDQGVNVTPTSPEEFLAYIKTETAKWAKVAKVVPLE